MKSTIAIRLTNFVRLRYTNGWGCVWVFKSLLKKGLHAERMTLCAWTLWSSQAKVTSMKSLSFFRSLKDVWAMSWKSFHRKHSVSSAIKENLSFSFPTHWLAMWSYSSCIRRNFTKEDNYLVCLFEAARREQQRTNPQVPASEYMITTGLHS